MISRRFCNIRGLCPRLSPGLIGLLAAASTFAAASLSADDGRAFDDGMAFFEQHVRPLLVNHCYECHSSRAEKREGGLLLDRRSGWSEGGDSGPAVVPGNPDASRLIQAVRYTDPNLQMPPDERLPPESIARLEQWVRMGAPDPRDEALGPGTGAWEKPSDPIAGRQHWAFRPLAAGPPPSVNATDWPRSTVDRFIMARLEAESLRPAPDASRRDLVRRLYVQLLGLPPTAEQIAGFLNDERPDARERLVDQLLHSPHWGERWGRHWLDLARYADSNGLDENFLFREAWRYRNWVIAAVNEDLPFDRFLTEQIAGDLLPYDSIEQRDRQRIAAGFLVVGPKVLLGNDDKKQRMEVADEQLDSIGRAILGQTLGCARCHDHKFDPIPTADYYALAGILTSTRVMERRYMLGEQRNMERLVGLGADGEERDQAYEEYWRQAPRVKERHKHAKAALELIEKGDFAGLDALAGKHSDALAEGAKDTAQTNEVRLKAQQGLLAELAKVIKNPLPIPPRAMIPQDVSEPSDERIRLAGQFDRPAERVPRGFLRVVGDSHIEIPRQQSGRIELARWLTDPHDGAGQLAARVLANRIWYHLIGRGIVRTVDNFGRTGEPPSHPELLDYLAQRLIASGWSVRSVVREIVLSRTFGMSSRHDETAHRVDPDNRLVWRAHRRRLDPEVLRDAMLSAAGELDLAPMDSTVWYLGDQATAVGDNKVRRRTDFHCRSVYLPVIRNDLPELFAVFNFADPHATTGMRPQTTVPTQGLYVLNDDAVMDAAAATARRLPLAGGAPDHDCAIDRMFELILGTLPTAQEREVVREFLHDAEARLAAEGGEDVLLRVWTLACQGLFATSRFQMLE